MQYEPIKRTLGKFFAGSPFLRKTLYFLLDILLLRTWHVKKALRKIAAQFPDECSDTGCGFGFRTIYLANEQDEHALENQSHTISIRNRLTIVTFLLVKLAYLTEFPFIPVI